MGISLATIHSEFRNAVSKPKIETDSLNLFLTNDVHFKNFFSWIYLKCLYVLAFGLLRE